MFIRILTYSLILFLFGCTQPLPKDEPPPEAAIKLQAAIDAAEQLEKQGNYQKAAQNYLEIAAQTNPPTRQGYQLSAIKAFLKADKFKEAKAELDKLSVSESVGLEIPLELVHIQIDLAEQRVSKAWDRLKAIDSSILPKPLQIEHQQIHAQAQVAKGNLLKAIAEFQSINQLANSDPVILRENNKYIWRGLSALKVSELNSVPQNDVVSGWIALAEITKASPQKHWRQNIKNWQLRFGKHPATEHIVPHLVQNLPPLTPLKEVALLLPLSGKFGARALAVQNGFFALAETGFEKNKPSIKVHDINADNILQVYQTVVDDGADFVVGPLEKGTLELLATHKTLLPVPTLGLNHLQTPVLTGNFYQFSLSPEDEARVVAARAWVDGHRTALLLVPEGQFGERVLEAFIIAWEEQGGEVVSQHRYGNNFKTSISKVLRGVKEVDMAFMLAFPQVARKIRPLFKSKLSDLPIYSTSHLYNGTLNPKRDAKLNGVKFVDMSWILAPDENGQEWQSSLQKSWPKEFKKYKRLFALGIDAYTLLSKLQQLSQLEWQGQTGYLSVDHKGIIHREQLRLAHFVEGKPQLLD